MVGIRLYGFMSCSGRNHLLDILPTSDTFFQASCHGRLTSEASYSSGKPETAIIHFSSFVENQKVFMFPMNFSFCGKTIKSWYAIGCCFCVAAAYLHKVELCSASNRRLVVAQVVAIALYAAAEAPDTLGHECTLKMNGSRLPLTLMKLLVWADGITKELLFCLWKVFLGTLLWKTVF